MTTEPPAMLRPAVLVLDVNETLSDLEPMRERFEQVGLPRHALDAWFAATLRKRSRSPTRIRVGTVILARSA